MLLALVNFILTVIYSKFISTLNVQQNFAISSKNNKKMLINIRLCSYFNIAAAKIKFYTFLFTRNIFLKFFFGRISKEINKLLVETITYTAHKLKTKSTNSSNEGTFQRIHFERYFNNFTLK